jgi:tetratricopeptide (TPR) repeat protein
VTSVSRPGYDAVAVTGYSTREVAQLLGLTPHKVRGWVRAGFLEPARDADGELRFSFQDLVLLRTAKGLQEAHIAPARVKRALQKLKQQLPSGRPLTAVAIGAEGNTIVVRDGRDRWDPEHGQQLFDFDVKELATQVAPLLERAAQKARAAEEGKSAADWFELGCTLEVGSPKEARDAYRRAIELDPHHADAHVNLGRLLQEAGERDAAEAHYRQAIDLAPEHAVAWFNLALLLEWSERLHLAVSAYERAIEHDPDAADAHYHAARVYEKLGQETAALRHLKAYRRLTQGR